MIVLPDIVSYSIISLSIRRKPGFPAPTALPSNVVKLVPLERVIAVVLSSMLLVNTVGAPSGWKLETLTY